jgi:urea transporter
MDRVLQSWEHRCAASTVLRFIDINLRGAGQVLFQDNPLSGLLFLIALGWGAIADGRPHVLIGGICALVTGTLTAFWLRADEASIRQGLYGYNAILIGLALTFFLGPSMTVLGYAMLAGAVTTIAMLGTLNARMPWSVPAHTYPFIFGTWIFLLAAVGFSGIPSEALPQAEELPALSPDATSLQRIAEFISYLLSSISQIYFKDHVASALFIIAGLAVSSIAAALFALGGALIAVVTAHLYGVESELISSGIQGFSPVLTAVAFGTVFYRPSFRVALYAALATVVTVVAQSALNTLLTPLGIPPLSAPFQLAALLLFIHKANVEPVEDDRRAGDAGP